MLVSLIDELETAARWVNHQMDPCPDWEHLLFKAAAEFRQVKQYVDGIAASSDEHVIVNPYLKGLVERYQRTTEGTVD